MIQDGFYAFEPTAYAFGKLQQNLALNPELVPRVAAEQIMLTDSPDGPVETEIYSSWPLSDTGTVLHPKHLGRPESTAGSRAVRLDDYVESASIQRVDFIKLDVDGFERHVLGGSIETLKKYRPVMLMELSPYVLSEGGRSLEELLEILGTAGYQWYRLKSRMLLSSDATQLRMIVPDGASLNAIARPG